SEEPDVARGALEAVADGVTVRLVDVEYASTSTRLHLEIERPEDVFARVGYYYRPPFDPEVHLEGFAPVDRLDITTIGRAEGDVDRIEYGLGEVLDPGQLLVFEISRLCAAESRAQGQCREGPWRFEWTPGAEAVDPADVTIPIDEMH